MNLNQPLAADCIYHIYNRGINSENLFKEERNYEYFLTKYSQYLSPVVDTFAYCLLKNHFHILIRVKDHETLNSFYNSLATSKSKKTVEGLHSADFIVSKQFARLFSSYSQAINKAFGRTGSLVETPFKRIEVTNDHYFIHLIWYIHFNPQKHGFVKDFREYPHSSYKAHLADGITKLNREEVIFWFGNKKGYSNFHHQPPNETPIKNFIIE